MELSIHTFDWQRIWLGDTSLLFLLEIVFRTTVMYLYALIAARFIGNRGMGPLTPFEFIIVIALGSATGDPMFYPDIPLIHGITVLTVIVLLERIFAEAVSRSKSIAKQLQTKPTIVVQNGKIHKDALKKTKLSQEELLMQLRMNGVKYLGHVETAYLEPSGTLSIFKYPKNLQRNTNNILP
jgi:uncharacterized membrane protein YcaP (DUF421 family)